MLREIIPGYPDSVRVAVPSAGRHAALGDVSTMIDGALAWRGMFGGGQIGGGSNAWAVNGNRTDNSRPLLANDPHLSVPQPSRWYLAHLSSGGNDVSGVTVPGVPAVVIGHNRSVAWGLTNAMLDDADFYIEKDDTARPGNYILAGKSVPYARMTGTIRVRDADSVELVVLSTVHGPVVNNAHPVTADDSAWRAPWPLTMRWTGAGVSDEIGAFLELNRARDAAEFERGLSRLAVPGQCVVYADTSGRIAYWTAGVVPVRPKGVNPMLPAQGWTGSAEATSISGTFPGSPIRPTASSRPPTRRSPTTATRITSRPSGSRRPGSSGSAKCSSTPRGRPPTISSGCNRTWSPRTPASSPAS
jgi:penicillin amidase